MAKFKYKVRDSAGKIQQGNIDSPSKDMAKTMLARKRMTVISLQEVTLDASGNDVSGVVLFGGRLRIDSKGNIIFGSSDTFAVPSQDLIIMTKQLATMLGSGLPVNQSFDILSKQQRLPKFGQVLAGIRKAIEEGNSLSQSLAKYPLCFDPLFRAMIKAGEESGKLPDIMNKLLTYIEKNAKIKQQVKSAMMYPSMIFVVAVVVIWGLLVFVVPTFTGQFKESGKELPWITQAVIDSSDFLGANWYKIFGVIAVAGFAFMKYAQTKSGKVYVDHFLIKAPVIGDVLRKISVGRFCSTMSSMLSSGVNLLQALTICASSAGNVVIEKFILDCKSKIEKGQQLSQPLSENTLFPKLVVSMVQVGEQAGKTDEMLEKVAIFYEDEVDQAIKAMLGLIEPIMIVGIGIVIGILVVAMYLPIMDLGSVVS